MGRVTPPVRVAGNLTNADYRPARPAEDASGQPIDWEIRTDYT